MSALPRIITTFIYPPIPIRSCDWQAHYEGEEDERMDTGHGATAAAAVVDLIENHPRGVECERDLPDWDDLRGRAPGATGDLSSEAFIRKLRDGWDGGGR